MNAHNKHNTASIGGEPDTEWLNHVEEQGAKGAGNTEPYVIIDKRSKSVRKAERAAMKAEQAVRQAFLHRNSKATRTGTEAGAGKI